MLQCRSTATPSTRAHRRRCARVSSLTSFHCELVTLVLRHLQHRCSECTERLGLGRIRCPPYTATVPSPLSSTCTTAPAPLVLLVVVLPAAHQVHRPPQRLPALGETLVLLRAPPLLRLRPHTLQRAPREEMPEMLPNRLQPNRLTQPCRNKLICMPTAKALRRLAHYGARVGRMKSWIPGCVDARRQLSRRHSAWWRMLAVSSPQTCRKSSQTASGA